MNRPTLIDQKLALLIQQGNTEASRRLHCFLAECDAALRELDSDPARYTVADCNKRREAIVQLRKQTQKEIEELHR